MLLATFNAACDIQHQVDQKGERNLAGVLILGSVLKQMLQCADHPVREIGSAGRRSDGPGLPLDGCRTGIEKMSCQFV